MGITVELTAVWPQSFEVTSWERSSISLTKFGM